MNPSDLTRIEFGCKTNRQIWPRISAIYAIVHVASGKLYIGSAKDTKIRWSCHRTSLRSAKHHSKHLQRSFNKYGEDCFVFRVLEVVESAANLVVREQWWLDNLKPAFNGSPTAGSQLGWHPSKKDIEKLRMRVRNMSPEAREAWKQKIREARKLQVFSPEVLKRRGRSHSLIPRTEEWKKRIGDANRGRVPPRHVTLAGAEAARLKLTGVPKSEATKAKMKAAAILREQRKREALLVVQNS